MPRGQPLNTMNPFSNNKPRLTASERIRNKRDAAIYQGEKQRFQRGKNKCRNRNVKFYKNGKVRSVINYKMQKSLARGNVLCNDCDDKGNLCAAPSKKDDLASVYMGNNNYSEFWGGGNIISSASLLGWTQTVGDAVISTDISGVWGGSSTDISKSELSGAILPNSDPSLNMPFGYIRNLIKIPRNLDGSGIIIDPSNILFPNELCDPFRYLKKTYLTTYIVARMAVPIWNCSEFTIASIPSTCSEDYYSQFIKKYVITYVQPNNQWGYAGGVFTGNVKSMCCVREVNVTETIPSTDPFLCDIPPGTYGIFDVYIQLFDVQNFFILSKLLKCKVTGSDLKWNWKGFSDASLPPVAFLTFTNLGPPLDTLAGATLRYIESINIIQGSIPPSQNQTKYNATLQSYMSCLENGIKNIKFTKQNIRLPVKNAFCSPVPPICQPEVNFLITPVSPTTSLPTFQDLNDGLYLLFDIGSNTTTQWNFNISDITNICDGETANLKIDYLVVGGGGSGGYSSGSGQVGTTGGGGGGDVRQGTFTISGGSTHNFIVQAGAGSPGIGNDATEIYTQRFTTDASSSRLELNSTLIAIANPGQNGASATFPVGISSSADFLGATEGGASGGGTFGGGIIIDPSTNNPVDGSGTPIVRGSAGGGGSNQDGSNNGVFGDTSTWYPVPGGGYLTSGGNGGDGVSSSITGSTVSYGGGGGGACFPLASPPPGINILPGLGANGGPGGNGANVRNTVGNAATQYGGGGGGSVYVDVSQNGGAGKRGVVILKFYNAPA